MAAPSRKDTPGFIPGSNWLEPATRSSLVYYTSPIQAADQGDTGPSLRLSSFLDY